MITSNKHNIIEEFKKKIQSLFNTHVYSQGNDRISMIIVSDITFKIDAFRTCPLEEIPMLLYSTGSKEFNIHMRSVAKKMGYTLNQKGLFKNGDIVPNLKSEEDYFNFLNIKFLLPEYR
jgi:DNA polymerase/3'-5' exonuclease PolX